MKIDNTVLAFQHPSEIDDPLTFVLRDGARRLLAQAIEAEADAFLAVMKDERLSDGRARLVRHGHGPQRTIQTGIGPVPVRRAKLRDRGAGENGAEGITFTSAILPRWARRTKSLDALLPVLYLRGISTGDFQEALALAEYGPQKGDPAAGALAITALAEDRLAQDDLDGAIALTERLEGEALEAARDWLISARARQDLDLRLTRLRQALADDATAQGADPL